ncbi:MAG: hypothetical protein ACWGOL_08050 [Desulfuromonadales bacterium]
MEKDIIMNRQTDKIMHGQTFSQSWKIANRALDDQACLLFRRFYRTSCAIYGQFTVSALAASLLYQLSTWSADAAALLNVLAAVSAFTYIGLAIQSHTGTQTLLNVLATPLVFAAAYAGFVGDPAWLTLSLAMHTVVSGLQIKLVDLDLRKILVLWTVFCGVLVVFLGIG